MLLFFLASLPAIFGLFFDLGGGCSCSSSCSAPPPINFGCRLMCAGQTMACQQQAFAQSLNQQQYAQPNYGAQAYQNNYIYQQQANYARQLPQFGYAQQQPPPAYVPPAPTRYVDSYATADNNAQSGYQPQTPGMAPAPAFENQNPLPATFVSAEQPAAASYSSETTRTDEVRLIPPEQSSSVVVQTAVQPDDSQQNTNYATAPQEVRTNYGQEKRTNNDISFSIAEKHSPEDIVKSIEESYEDQEETQEQQQVTASVPRLDFKAISVNHVTLPTVSYVTTDRIPPALQETDENEVEEVKPEPKTMEYALGSLSPAKAMVPDETLKAAAQQYKTLTRGEGTSKEDKISQSGYDYKDAEPRKAEEMAPAPEPIASTEDYASEEKGEEDTAAEEGSEDPSGYKKLRSVERTIDPTEITETTTDARPAKRSQVPDSNTFKCNSEKLKEIMEAKMTVSAPVSKQLIYAEATAEFPGLSLDVICSRHSFSYIVVTSPIYCEHRKSPLTCFAFFQP